MARVKYIKMMTEEERMQLYEGVWSETIDSVAKTYGVSGNTIRNWCKSMEIPYPRRGELERYRIGECIREELMPPRESQKENIAPFRIVFEDTNNGEQKLSDKTRNQIKQHINKIYDYAILESSINNKNPILHEAVRLEIIFDHTVQIEIYHILCLMYKKIYPEHKIEKDIVDNRVIDYFISKQKGLCDKLDEVCNKYKNTNGEYGQVLGPRSNFSINKNQTEYVKNNSESIDKVQSVSMSTITCAIRQQKEIVLQGIFGEEYDQYYYEYNIKRKPNDRREKLIDIMEINKLVGMMYQWEDREVATRIANTLFKTIEVYATDMRVLNPYNIFKEGDIVDPRLYYNDGYLTYIKIYGSVWGIKLDRETNCLSMKFVQGQGLDREQKHKYKTKILSVNLSNNSREVIIQKLSIIIVEFIESVNALQNKRSKRYKSRGIKLV